MAKHVDLNSARAGWTEVRSLAPAILEPHAVGRLADRIHDDVLQLLGSAMLKAELCEQLGIIGRASDIPARLQELREVLDLACTSLRDVMVDLREAGHSGFAIPAD